MAPKTQHMPREDELVPLVMHRQPLAGAELLACPLLLYCCAEQPCRLGAPGAFAQAGFAVTDVRQGVTNDCWFLAIAATIARNHPELLKSIIRLADGQPGVAEVRVWRQSLSNNAWLEILALVRRQSRVLPCGAMGCCRWAPSMLSFGEHETWVQDLQLGAALALRPLPEGRNATPTRPGIRDLLQMNGGYPADAMTLLLGPHLEVGPVFVSSDAGAQRIFDAAINRYGSRIIGACSTGLTGKRGGSVVDMVVNYCGAFGSGRIVPSHVYGVISRDANNGRWQLYNPYGFDFRSLSKAAQVSPDKEDNGLFWMSDVEFDKHFVGITYAVLNASQ